MKNYFQPRHLRIVDEALIIAEETVSDRFGLTCSFWKRHPFDVKSLLGAMSWERVGNGYAQLFRYAKKVCEKRRGSDNPLVFYRIVLNDQRIISTTESEAVFRMKPLLVYILIHELLHIVRFTRFCCHFDHYDRLREEKTVHKLTCKMINHLPIPGIHEVASHFQASA